MLRCARSDRAVGTRVRLVFLIARESSPDRLLKAEFEMLAMGFPLKTRVLRDEFAGKVWS